MPTLPPLRQARRDERSATAEPPSRVVSPGREVHLVKTSRRAQSPTVAESPTVVALEARLKKERLRRKKEDAALAALYVQRENGFRYNAFATPSVFSTFGTDTLVLQDRERKELEIAVSQRRAKLEHDRKAREISRQDELRRRKAEQQRIMLEHEKKVAQEEREVLRKAEEAAAQRKQRQAALNFAAKRRLELEQAKDLSGKREAVRDLRRNGGRSPTRDPDYEAEMLLEDRHNMARQFVSQVLSSF